MRRACDVEDRITLAEFDDDRDGVFTRGVACEYGIEDLKTMAMRLEELDLIKADGLLRR